MSNKEGTKIDEALYSRQLYVLGFEAMEKISGSKVILLGLDGLGVEIAKNLLLGGIKTLFIYDDRKVTIEDLSTQFYLDENCIGKDRAVSCIDKLSQLNHYSRVALLDEYPTNEIIKMVDVVVASGIHISECIKLCDTSRKNGVHFISTDTVGLFGYAFADLGDEFTVIDKDGEDPITHLILSISKEEVGVVTCIEDARHGLSDGSYVTFSDVRGMTELNDLGPVKIKVFGPFTFGICDTRNFGDYEADGIFTEVKMPENLKYVSLSKSLKKPEFLITDFAKCERPLQLHVAFQTLYKFLSIHNHFPRSRCEEDAKEFLALAKSVCIELEFELILDEPLIKEVSFQASGKLPPMASVLGGFVSQEILKACSSRFMPLKQFMYFDSLESLPTNFKPTLLNVTSKNGRYDPQISVLGSDFVERMHNAKGFLVGAGAIGCELLKLYALSGLGSGQNGCLVVTDMDNIEESNLNRQFLFRRDQIGKAKSSVACDAAIEMNQDLRGKVIAKQDRLDQDNEKIFDEKFWTSLDFVMNALDNIDTRKYVDSKCVLHRKPMVDSGTLGTKGNTQVVIPFITESYSSSQDPPEKSIPVCTLKNFPNAIEHTIQWARDLFTGLFESPVKNFELFIEDESFIRKMFRQAGGTEILANLYDFLVKDNPSNFVDCIKWSRYKFDELFSSNIKQLLYNFPSDVRTSSGSLFWSGPKKMPHPISFDASNELHINFIVSASSIFANMHNIKPENDIKLLNDVLQSTIVPDFIPKSGVKIATSDAELGGGGGSGANDIDELVKNIPPPQKVKDLRFCAVEFDKDNDKTRHIDFISAAANLRAINYSIKVASKHKVKLIAGKIIPAIATTTSLVSGLAMLELYKIIDERKKIEDFKNGFINLALPFFSFSEPLAPAKGKYNGKEFSLWDRFEINYDITIQGLLDYFQKEHGLEVSMISCGTVLVFAPFLNRKKADERARIPISKVIESIKKSPIPTHVNSLVLDAIVTDGKTDGDVSIFLFAFHKVDFYTFMIMVTNV